MFYTCELTWGTCLTLQPGLTYAKSKVEQAHPDVQPEEQDDVGHFAEQDDVAHMLFHSYWQGHMTSSEKHISIRRR